MDRPTALPTPARFSCIVADETLARGVSLCLVTAGQWFECSPLQDGRFRFTVGAAGRRFLPVACYPADDGESEP